MAVVATEFSLSDRYERVAGRVLLTGIQALARLPIDQCRRDAESGTRTGAYISGYEGSPLAGYDLELARQTRLLDDHSITFEPGLNEEAAAMAVQGSQLIGDRPSSFDGVTGYWYGKSPGLDRASDAFRHANMMGTTPTGGAVAFVGDDPASKSSSIPCTSERALADLGMPTFYPADAGEILEMGRHAVALSRASGLWTALKIVTSVADGAASVDLADDSEAPRIPPGAHTHQPSAKLIQPRLAEMERDLVGKRMTVVEAYCDLNSLNPVTIRGERDTIGIVAAGKTYLDVREGLAKLGLDDEQLTALGIRLMKVGLIWPLHPGSVVDFASGLATVIVVEEKRSFLETALREILYAATPAPAVLGKHDRVGAPLFPAFGELDADGIAAGLARVLSPEGELASVSAWSAGRESRLGRERRQLPLVMPARTPYFCSGCPHNTSTKTMVDSPVGAGIGCHGLVLVMDPEHSGDVIGATQMGGEGTQWLGMAPFVDDDHFIQNLGDGTFHHSGSLAIRAAVASGRNITYRLLHNSAVAMTGGQQAVGKMPLGRLVSNLLSEGVARVIITTADVRATRRAGLPPGVSVWDRARTEKAQRVLAATAGVTVLLHDQECAAELRRKRKRDPALRPTTSVAIDERLCEGCGDCAVKSNCLSLHPLATEFGDKTTIHQSSCNADFSCVKGDCPAFLTVRAGGSRRETTLPDIDAAALPAAPVPTTHDHQIRLMGIGGLGIVTTSQVLATAAFLAGRQVRTLDQTGMAQKGGAVVSDIKIGAPAREGGNKIGVGQCDLYMGYDLLVAAEPRNAATLAVQGTAVVSTGVVPTGAMVRDRDITMPSADDVVRRLSELASQGQVIALDAGARARDLFGSDQFANLLLLGVAHQSGALRLSAEAIETAIELNGVAVAKNIQSFRRGRQYVADPTGFSAAVQGVSATVTETPAPVRSEIVQAPHGSELERLVAVRRAELARYQNEKYARRYEQTVESVRVAEATCDPRSSAFSEAVARSLHKLMAYKDEYEVARLALASGARQRIRAEFGDQSSIAWNLHPPVLRALGMNRKIRVGRWFGPIFRALYAFRFLRGTPLDPFGFARVRRTERRLVREFESSMLELVNVLEPEVIADAVELATLPDRVRGYEHVKLRNVEEYDRARAEVLGRIGGHSAGVTAPKTATNE